MVTSLMASEHGKPGSVLAVELLGTMRCSWDDVEVAEASAWQQGIIDGSVEIPFWSQETCAREKTSEVMISCGTSCGGS